MPEKDAVIDAASHLEEAERLKEEGNEVRFILKFGKKHLFLAF